MVDLSVCMPDANIYIHTPEDRAMCIFEGPWVKLATCYDLAWQVNAMKSHSTGYVLKDTCMVTVTQS